jgi:RNA recognition motif-containing protein
MKNIYIGNLNSQTTENDLRALFEPYGIVEQVSIPRDSATGNSRGFAFVEMKDDSAGEEAIRRLNGSPLGSRKIVVNEARHRAERADPRRSDRERGFGRG